MSLLSLNEQFRSFALLHILKLFLHRFQTAYGLRHLTKFTTISWAFNSLIIQIYLPWRWLIVYKMVVILPTSSLNNCEYLSTILWLTVVSSLFTTFIFTSEVLWGSRCVTERIVWLNLVCPSVVQYRNVKYSGNGHIDLGDMKAVVHQSVQGEECHMKE